MRSRASNIPTCCAFAPELDALLARTNVEREVERNGVEFALGTLAGKPVVVFASGISMVNAAMVTQLAIERSAVLVARIADNPDNLERILDPLSGEVDGAAERTLRAEKPACRGLVENGDTQRA